MTEKRKLVLITLPVIGITIRPPAGETYINEAYADEVKSTISKDLGGYSHDFIYTYNDGTTETK